MKIVKNIIKVILLVTLCLIIQNLFFVQRSNAAIESKAGTAYHNGISVNQSFQYCYDMRYPTSSLGNNSLDPHLVTANDWGGVAYLGLSSYGAVKKETGATSDVVIDNRTYSTLTGNKTGVLNFGSGTYGNNYTSNYVQTATYLDGSTANNDRSKLYLASNARLVNKISATNDVEHTKGQAAAETSGWYNVNGYFKSYPNLDNPISMRRGVYGYNGTSGQAISGNGITYRPVIWN